MSAPHITFQQQLDILIYAVYATEPVTGVDLRNFVVDCDKNRMSMYLRSLQDAGLLERIDYAKYRATSYAKELMGVKQI
ncbi:hypothetical protein [Acinetobacter sp. HY1485]|uniref:hypothetical protein n=1 Tax=Acinetobacter sp. HY1485 TaxID=2970918 RepID=UPI0022B97C0A|nr:hypothetical protein [Acinetobacter sp. HY1485]